MLLEIQHDMIEIVDVILFLIFESVSFLLFQTLFGIIHFGMLHRQIRNAQPTLHVANKFIKTFYK